MAKAKGVIYGRKADEQIQKTVREVSRRMMNNKPHRGRWQQNQSISIRHGIVRAQLGCGYYTIELATWNGNKNTVGAGNSVGNSGTGSVDTDCNPCYNTSGVGTTSPTVTLTYPALQVTGISTSVTAYDEETRLVPLKVDSGCLLVNLGDLDADGTTAIWQVVRGLQQHIVAYKDRYQCCADGTEVLVGRTPYIFAAIECAEMTGGECPS